MNHQTEKPRRKKRHWTWLLGGLLATFLVGAAFVWHSVNRQARQQVTSKLHESTGLSIDVGDTSVMPGGIEARDVTVGDAANPVLSAEKMSVDAPIRELAGDTPQIDAIRVENVTLALWANEDGSLEWPFKTEGIGEFPSDRIEIINGSVVIHQPNCDKLTISGVTLQIEKRDTGIHLEGEVGNLLDSNWKVSGSALGDKKLDLTLSTDEISIDSKSLAKKPVVSAFVGEEPFELTGSVKVGIAKTDDTTPLRCIIELDDASLSVPNIELDLSDVFAKAEIDRHAIDLQDLSASVGKGRIEGTAKIDLRQSPYRGRFELSLSGVLADTMQTVTQIPDYVSGDASGKLTGEFQLTNNAVELSLDGKATITNTTVKEIPLEELEATLSIRRLRIDRRAPVSIEGDVQLRDLLASDVPIETLFKFLPDSAVDRLPRASGTVTGKGTLDIPLQTASSPTTWSATATINSANVAVSDIPLQAIRSDMQLDNGVLSLLNVAIELNDASKVSGSAHLHFDGTQPSRLELAARNLSAQNIADLLRNDGAINGQRDSSAQEFSGFIDFDAALQFPIHEFDATKVTGEVSLSSQQLDWHALVFRNLSSVARIADSQLVIESVSAHTASDGIVTANGVVPFDGQQLARAEIKGKQLPIADLVGHAANLSPDFGAALERLSRQHKQGNPPHSGNVSFSAELAGRLAQANTVSAWSGKADIRSSDAQLFSSDFTSVDAKVVLEDGEIQLRTFGAALVGGGELSGQALLPLNNDRDARFAIRWSDLPIKDVSRFTGLKAAPTGQTSGNLKLAVPDGRFDAVAAVDGSGKIALNRLTLAGSTFDDILADVRLNSSRIQLQNIRMRDSNKLSARATIEMMPPYRYVADVDSADVQLHEVVNRIGSKQNSDGLSFGGLATLTAHAAGSLDGKDINARGRIGLQQLRFGEQRFSDIDVRFANVENRTDSLRLEGDVFGGQIDATIDLPNSLSANKQIEFSLTQWRLQEFEWLANESARFGFEISGQIDANGTIDAWDDPALRTAQLNIRDAQAQYAGIDLRKLDLELTLKDRAVEYRLVGTVLDGDLSVTGKTTLADGFIPTTVPIEIHVHAAKLQSLGNESARYEKLKPLAGAIDLQLDLQSTAPDFVPTGTGTVSTRDVSWQQKSVSSMADSQLKVENGLVRLQGLQAGVGNGTVSGSIDLPLTGTPGSYDLSVRRIDLATLLPFTDLRTERSGGNVSGRLSGTIGPQIRGRGDVELRQPSVGEFNAGTVRIPVTFVVDTKDLSGRVATRRMTADWLGGQITSDATIDFGRRLNINAQVQLTKIDSGELVESMAGIRDFDQGKLSGTLQLSGNSVRSMRDLQGRFLGKLADSQFMQFPVLNELSAFTNTGRVSRSSFDSGELDFRLSNGVISTPGVAFQSDQAELFITGTANINQRLDLLVALQTGNISPSFGLDSLIRSPAGTLALPGASAILEAAEFLSNRVVYVHVGGTFNSPHFRLQTDRILRDELLRYYLPTAIYQQIRNNR